MVSSYKTPDQKRDEWLRELEYRQRNIVFPETVMNSGHFWRSLAYSKYPLSAVQKAGVIILLFMTGIPGMVFLGARTLMHAVFGPAAEPRSSGAEALVFLLSQVLMIAVMYRVLMAVFTAKKPLDDLRFRRRSARF